MAGTGQGMLQPTKLIQNDDFMESIALPGYYSFQSAAMAANADQPLYRVPDGMTCEVVDFGITALQANVVETKGATCTDVTLNAKTKNAVVNVMAAAGVTGGGGETTTLAMGSSASILRGSIPTGAGTGTIDLGYQFTEASKALNNQYGPGTEFQFTFADVAGGVGTGATGEALVWIRLKFVANDARAI